jgi:phenylalanyl-tRNA synthetase beta chain
VGAGRKSLAFNLTFFSPQRTLTEEEIDLQLKKIVASLEHHFSARLRE